MSDELCDRALKTLISAGFLVRTRDGRYTRPHFGRPTAGSIVTLLGAMGSNQ